MLLEYMCNVDVTVLTSFNIFKKRKNDNGKCNIADLVNLKCKETNHYNRNCLLCQHCWLLCCTRTCGDSKRGAPSSFCIQITEKLRQQRISFQHNIIHYCMHKRIFSYIVLTAHSRTQCGPFMGPKCWEWTNIYSK